MRIILSILISFTAAITCAEEAPIHHFRADGTQLPAGWPQDITPAILTLAGKPLLLEFDSALPNPPAAQLHRVSSARKIPINTPAAESNTNGWKWTWTPPQARGPSQYEVRFASEPARTVRIESRDPVWFQQTLEKLSHAHWIAEGLSRDELAALADRGLRVSASGTKKSNAPASLQMIPKQGEAARRRVVWDQENHTLVVWRPGPASGDWDIRAPRWWISPAALATDQGLIRLLDLFSEPPLNP